MILYQKANDELAEAESREDFRVAEALKQAKVDTRKLLSKAKKLTTDDVTDEKFQIESQKRAIAQTIDSLTRDKHIITIKMDYQAAKKHCQNAIESYEPQPKERESFEYLMSQEKQTLASNSRLKINELVDKLYRLSNEIRWRDGDYVKNLFYYAAMQSELFSDKKAGEKYIKEGETAIEKEKFDKLRVCVNALFNLLPDQEKQNIENGGTGIG
jgi:molecular chaperone DnaK